MTNIINKFAIGDMVTYKPGRHNAYINVGKIYGPVPDDPKMVLVEFAYGHINKCNITELVTIEEAEEIKSQLEIEFQDACNKVKPQALEAIAMLTKANELAYLHGITISNLSRDVTNALTDQISSAGWNTSSFNC